MKILIVGSGGREHAIALKLSTSPHCEKIFWAPGNGGTKGIAEAVPVKAEDIGGLLAFAEKNIIDLTIVGPEVPLSMGIVDRFRERGLAIFGPSKKAGEIESSKSFCKEFLKRHNIPTADFAVYSDFEPAKRCLESLDRYPVVIKADGLAAGKGVFIIDNRDEAVLICRDLFEGKILGDAGTKIIIEECLSGKELSIMALTDGNSAIILPPSQDHKRIGEGNTGPNTGGMGAYSPLPFLSKELEMEIIDKIMIPAINGLKEEGRKFTGCLYAGLMLTERGLMVLEFNCRFGDPETEAIIPLVDEDLLPLLCKCVPEFEGKWGSIEKTRAIKTLNKSSCAFVLASEGYPGKYKKGAVITIPETLEDAVAYHAGTAYKDGTLITNGGRVIIVTSTGITIDEAREKALSACKAIGFEGKYYRRDIAKVQ